MFVAAFCGKVTILSPNLDPKARILHVTFRLFFRPGPKRGPRGDQEVPKETKKRPGGAQGDPKGNPGSAQGTQKESWGICLGHGGGKAAGNWIIEKASRQPRRGRETRRTP